MNMSTLRHPKNMGMLRHPNMEPRQLGPKVQVYESFLKDKNVQIYIQVLWRIHDNRPQH